MKDIQALPIEIDNNTIYVTAMEYENGKIRVDILPDPTLPEYMDEVFINKVIYDIIMCKEDNSSSEG